MVNIFYTEHISLILYYPLYHAINNNKSEYVIDITVPTDDNIDKIVTEKKRKYLELCYQLRQLYRLDHFQAYPAVIFSNGIIFNASAQLRN